MEYRRSAQAVFDSKYYAVRITMIRQICKARDVRTVGAAASPDHIHMLLSGPADLAPVKLVQYIKGRSSRRLQDEFPEPRNGAGAAFARRWTRSTKRRSASTSKTRNGTNTIKDSKSQRPPSLKPALSQHGLQTALACGCLVRVHVGKSKYW